MESDLNFIKNNKPHCTDLAVNIGKYLTLKNFNQKFFNIFEL